MQITQAKLRKELGNPPGKKGDPIGDQLSWEQLLEKSKNSENLWIITNDDDYIFEFNKKCYLNSFLYKELKNKNKDINILCFNTLAESLQSFTTITKIKITTLPKKKQLLEIKEEEKESNISKLYSQDSTGSMLSRISSSDYITALSPISTFEGIDIETLECPICNTKTIQFVTSKKTQSGYRNKYYCTNCKKFVDPENSIDYNIINED